MLDVRNSALGVVGTQPSGTPHQPFENGNSETTDQEQLPTHLIQPVGLSTDRTSISLHDMISTSLALKSNMAVEITRPVSQWPHSLFPPSTPPAGNVTSQSFSPDDGTAPSQIIQVISALQREILLLRNELNFELWLSRENVKHIGRLHENRILAKTAEVERQGLVSFHCVSVASIFIPRSFDSSTNFGSTELRSSVLKLSSANRNSKPHQPKTSMPIGIGSFRRN
jgi:hypothetical protein